MFTAAGIGAGATLILQLGGIAMCGTLVSNVLESRGAKQLASIIGIGTYLVLGFFVFMELDDLIVEINQVFKVW